MRIGIAVVSLAVVGGAQGEHLSAQAIPTATSKPIKVATLRSNGDARVQGDVATNFGSGDLIVGLRDKVVFVHFDLKALPAGAVIHEAQLTMSFRPISEGANQVQLGRVEAGWREATIAATNQPAVAWHSGTARTVTPGSTISFDVKPVLDQWLAGEPNYGFAIRGDGPLMYGYSRETAPSPGAQPSLRLRYIVP